MTLEEKAKNRFNKLMRELALDYLQIDECGEGTQNWNLRDMIAECDYQLSTYYEGGHINEEMREDDPKGWRSEVCKLMRFIKAYAPMAENIIETERHSSRKFDNK